MPLKRTPEHPTWKIYTFKADDALTESIERYYHSVEELGSKGAAIRLLVAAGLESVWGQDINLVTTVHANAKAAALRRFSFILEEAIRIFRDEAYGTMDEMQEEEERREERS